MRTGIILALVADIQVPFCCLHYGDIHINFHADFPLPDLVEQVRCRTRYSTKNSQIESWENHEV